MKTNQMMQIKIGDYGVLNIGHKDRMGKVQDVIDMCNVSDKLKGGKGNYKIEQALRSVDLWKYIFEVAILDMEEEQFSKTADSAELNNVKTIADYSIIYDNLDKDGKVKYEKLMKMFPHLIKSKRGKYGGTWARLEILLKIAGNVDKAVEARVYKTFIDDNILNLRDFGGEAFKRLNKAIDKLEGLPDKPDRYIEVSTLINRKVNDKLKLGWNNKDTKLQEKRGDICDLLEKMIKLKTITTYKELLKVIERF
jgi:hypothetical protein